MLSKHLIDKKSTYNVLPKACVILENSNFKITFIEIALPNGPNNYIQFANDNQVV